MIKLQALRFVNGHKLHGFGCLLISLFGLYAGEALLNPSSKRFDIRHNKVFFSQVKLIKKELRRSFFVRTVKEIRALQ